MFVLCVCQYTTIISYTGMDKTSLGTSCGSLFVRMSQDVHVTSNVITYHCSAWHNRTSTYVIT